MQDVAIPERSDKCMDGLALMKKDTDPVSVKEVGCKIKGERGLTSLIDKRERCERIHS
jgi:hypothetical protein